MVPVLPAAGLVWAFSEKCANPPARMSTRAMALSRRVDFIIFFDYRRLPPADGELVEGFTMGPMPLPPAVVVDEGLMPGPQP